MLKLSNVSMTFEAGTVNERRALNNINLHLEKGEFVTIIGSNGAGKSTLFGAIAGAFLPDTGRVELDGKDITFMPEHKRAKRIGRMLQDPKSGTAPNMTVAENLMLAYNKGSGKKFDIGLRKSELDFFKGKLAELKLGLEDRLETKIGLLSGGQRQAVTLLMATLSSPDLLLLDEHTAALDPSTAEKVLDLTEFIVRRDRIATLMITHNIGGALKVGSRTIMMDEGEIILDIKGAERAGMTVEKLLEMFKSKSKKDLDNDRILLVK